MEKVESTPTETPSEIDTHTEHTSKKDSKLSQCWKKCKTACQKVHPTWYITLGFVLLLTGVIMHYEYRDDGYWWYHHMPMMQVHMVSPRDDWRDGYFDDVFEDMDRRFRDMERRHASMMRQISEMSPDISTGNYAGTRIENSSRLTYNISKNTDTLSGTIMSTETGTLGSLEKSLWDLGYSVTKKDNTLTFSWDAKQWNAIMELLR